MQIRNPILPGSHPDPCILRVGDDFYLATSTFEWFPGVQIHHSRNLVHWQLVNRPLDRASQLDLVGNCDSGGVWAPALSWHGGQFFLVYTNTRRFLTPFNDQHNFLVTADDVRGPWSQPIYLHSKGFDPSLFHDDDGRHWLLSMLWDHRPGRNHFAGIIIQEFSWPERRLVGPTRHIFDGTVIGITEGPHLYRRGGWYYLVTAEGGTSYEHAVTIARSRRLFGPYEVHPDNPILTSRDDRTWPLQKAGHASLVETHDGRWYLAHLVSRPLPGTDRCLLGRETALQGLVWGADEWPRLAHGGRLPAIEIDVPNDAAIPTIARSTRCHFTGSCLPLEFQSLRIPATEDWLSFSQRPGWLRLQGQESPMSTHRQSVVGRRIQSFVSRAETHLDFQPTSFQQMAGLMAWYNTRKWYYLFVTYDEPNGRRLGLSACDDGDYREFPEVHVDVPADARCRLAAEISESELTFRAAFDTCNWFCVAGPLDASILSDDYGSGFGFTGAFYALGCHDMSGARCAADFEFFEYQEADE